MQTYQSTQATAAGATTPNVLSGNVYENAPYDGQIRFSMTAEAAGESRVTIYVGSRIVVPESSVSRAARVPLIPDDVLATSPMRRGEKITIQHRNTGAGSNTLFYRIDLRPGR